MKYSLRKKLFKRPKYPSHMHWKSNIFGHSATIFGVFWVSLNYYKLQENGMPKNGMP